MASSKVHAAAALKAPSARNGEPAVIHVKEHMRSFWTGYQYKHQPQEEEYSQRHELTMVRALQVWGITRLIFDTVLPLTFIYTGVDVWFFLAYIPNLVIVLGTLLVVSFIPRCRKYVVVIISITSVLMATAAGWQVTVHTKSWFDNAMDVDLAKVAQRLVDDPAALQDLRFYTRSVLSGYLLNLQLALLLPQALLIAFAGLWRSTILACVLMPIGMGIPVFLSPEVPWHVVAIRLVGGVMIVGYLMYNITTVTLGRRRSFLLERSFQSALELAVEASRQADSILNHTLKNTMADAAGDIDMFLNNLQSADGVAHLRQSLASLRKGMRSCRHRQAYLQLAAQQYNLALHPVDLADFASELTSGRHVTLDIPRVTVLLDPTLCGLILDNALSNAFKHGHPDHPSVKLTITWSAHEDDRVGLLVKVSNAANPAKPSLTQDYVLSVLKGEAKAGPATSAMSDRIGLQHSFLAAKAHGMAASLRQSGDEVVFQVQATTRLVQAPQVAGDDLREAYLGAFPRDLQVYGIDDSAPARRLLHHNLIHWATTPNVHIYGAEQSDVAKFTRAALENGDIVILDQHLEYGGDNNFLGTDIVEQLVAHRFAGLICIRSGNNALPDLAKYQDAGAHCAFGKDVSMRQMIDDIKVAYVRHIVKGKPRVDLVPGLAGHALRGQRTSADSASAHCLRQEGVYMHVPRPGPGQASGRRSNP